jgi:hypothetical protein
MISAFWDQNGPPGGPKWLPGGFRGPLGRQVARWRAKGGVRNREKSILVGPGGARRKFSDRFQPSGGARGSVLGLFWLPLGWFLGLCLAVFLAIPKIKFFANTLSENLIFEAPGESFSEPFSSQNGSEKRLRLEMDPNGHQIQKNELPSALGGPRGPKNKFWKFLKPAETERRVCGGTAEVSLEDPPPPGRPRARVY